ncbi:hypothetical protein [Mesorhizobium sp. J8]|uniref:hypothetical protein n=1 Tax=Mesorhizobium sp. J8 TaxID=2777475 RepID=UPI0019153B2C|nr:hypothetical protein [Mesorhizobium sp. J8]BCM19194.1 hypothetical protein MJ8_29660 [Mesorhizobium sp. J8]
MKNFIAILGPFARRLLGASVCLFVVSAGHCAFAAELIKNGSFDDPGCTSGKAAGCKYWVFKGNSAVNDDSHSGKLGASVGGLGSGTGSIRQTVALNEGRYTFSFWYIPRQKVAGKTPAIAKIAGRIVFATMLGSEQPDTHWSKAEVVVYISEKDEGERQVEFFADNAPDYSGPLFDIDDVSLTR